MNPDNAQAIHKWGPPKKSPFDPPIDMPEGPPHLPDDDDDHDDWDQSSGR